MTIQVDLEARWVAEDAVWLATSSSWPGLVVEAPAWPELLREIELVLPDFLEVQGLDPTRAQFTVRAEDHRQLPAA